MTDNKIYVVYLFSLLISVLLIYLSVFLSKQENEKYKNDIIFGLIIFFCVAVGIHSLYLIMYEQYFENYSLSNILLICVSILLVVFSSSNIKDSNDTDYVKEITQLSIVSMILGSLVILYSSSDVLFRIYKVSFCKI